ncbi:MAG: VCBS repeat-containing protein [Planctomycetes bacterium]|nr:VCBS repeat-containing protein [Planctomycetota bacterium]
MRHSKLHIVPLALLAIGGSLQAQGEVLRLAGATGAAASIADLDGDGRREFLVAQPALVGSPVQIFRAGDGQVLRTHPAPASVEYGASVAALDDVSGDGVEDYAIAAPASSSGLPSFVEFRSGANGALLASFVAPNLPESLGLALARVADIDLDGVDDVLISARTRTPGSPNRVYLISGASGAVLRTHMPSIGNIYDYGSALAALGDVNGDGRADYAIADNAATDAPGMALVVPSIEVFSGANGVLLYRLAASNFAFAGSSLASLGGDLDGDNVADFAIGVPGRVHAFGLPGWCGSSHTGAVDLHSGATGALIRSVIAPLGNALGLELAALGDLNGNGSPDFVSVARVGCEGLGAAYFFDGLTGAVLGQTAYGAKGVLAAAGDVNFDGRRDVLIGGPFATSVVLGAVRAPISYCSPSLNSLGCMSNARVEGSASASIGPELELVAPALRAQRVGLFFWGTASTAVPFGPGTMCVAAPRVRLPLSGTGGSSGCSGELRTTLSRTYLAANGLVPGSVFYAQAWARDSGSPASQTQLSSALEVTVWP